MFTKLKSWLQQRSQGSAAQREVVSLAWPIASAMLGETLMGLVDTKLVGGLGASALGGVGVANSLIGLTYITLLGLMRGVKVCTAHAAGRGQPTHGVRYAQAGVVIGLVAGTLSGALFPHAGPMLNAVHITPELIPNALAFLGARAWGIPAACALAALIEHRQGLGDVRTPMIVGLVGNVVNAGLAFGLIYGRFGLPALGVRGAGIGTTITEILQLGALLVLLFHGERRRKQVLGAVPPLPWKVALHELLVVGLPTALHFGAEMLAIVMFTAILGSLSQADVAAHQIASSINRLAYLFGAAIAEATCILVGRALGAQRLEEADQSVWASVKVACVFMVACGALFAVFGGVLARCFTNDPEVVQVVTRLLLIAGVWQLLDAINVVMRAALRGAKDVRAAAIIGVTILWTCVPTTVYLLGKVAGWGVIGGWCGFLLGTILSAALFSQRWRKGAWRQRFVLQRTPVMAPAAVLERVG